MLIDGGESVVVTAPGVLGHANTVDDLGTSYSHLFQ
jgi:hypothetical protein